MRKRGRCHIHRPSAGKTRHPWPWDRQRPPESTDHSSSAVDEQSSQIAIPASADAANVLLASACSDTRSEPEPRCKPSGGGKLRS
jgi:hypothetical protein